LSYLKNVVPCKSRENIQRDPPSSISDREKKGRLGEGVQVKRSMARSPNKGEQRICSIFTIQGSVIPGQGSEKEKVTRMSSKGGKLRGKRVKRFV